MEHKFSRVGAVPIGAPNCLVITVAGATDIAAITAGKLSADDAVHSGLIVVDTPIDTKAPLTALFTSQLMTLAGKATETADGTAN